MFRISSSSEAGDTTKEAVQMDPVPVQHNISERHFQLRALSHTHVCACFWILNYGDLHRIFKIGTYQSVKALMHPVV
jgi:hypothetical protein